QPTPDQQQIAARERAVQQQAAFNQLTRNEQHAAEIFHENDQALQYLDRWARENFTDLERSDPRHIQDATRRAIYDNAVAKQQEWHAQREQARTAYQGHNAQRIGYENQVRAEQQRQMKDWSSAQDKVFESRHKGHSGEDRKYTREMLKNVGYSDAE